MRHILTAILSLILVITVNAQVARPQNGAPTRITHHWQGTPLSQVLNIISQESNDYHIHYIHEQLDSIRIYAKIQGMTVPDAINKVTKGQPVKVKTKDHDIFIQYKKSAGKRKLVLSSKVMDSRSHTYILDATVQLLTTDSIVIDQKKAGRTFMVLDRTYSNSEFNFEVPKAVANYIIRVSHVNYETAYLNISLSKIGKWEVQRDLPPVYLKEKRHVLKEVNVVASKVMFYYRGDTIVYNADAFQLAEGSMLDALVKQLPGVELKEGGRIYHNGKFVQNLLLNGKDFFRGHQELMLENLPSYTVKEIKVYDKYGRQSELSGEQLPFDKEYVMDVQLKREYSIGWLVNADAGAGTNDRYLARLFAMRHTDHSKIAIIGNVNNLNDEETPGETKAWKAPIGTFTGRKARKMIGVDYDIEQRDKIWYLVGDAELSFTDLDQRDKTERTNYLTTGDTYDHSQSANRNKMLQLKSTNIFYYKTLSIWQTIEYNKADLQSGSKSLTLSSADSLLNQQIRQGMTHNHSLKSNTSIIYYFDKALKGTSLSIDLVHTDQDDDRFNRYEIKYGNQQPDNVGDQYTKGHPNWTTRVSSHLYYSFNFSTKTSISTRYKFEYMQQHQQSALYLLDRIDSLQQQPFGTLPSTLDYEQAMDFSNSYNSRRKGVGHFFFASFIHKTNIGKGKLNLALSVPLNFRDGHLSYQRGKTDTTIFRKNLLLENLAFKANWKSNDQMRSMDFQYVLNESAPDLINYVNIHDTTDPMNLQEGNNDLGNTFTHHINLQYDFNNQKKQTSYGMELTYNNIQNALAKGYSYDPTTGVRVWKPYNVNGNWDIGLNGQVDLPLDKKKKLMFRSFTSLSYLANVDMLDEQRSEVNTFKARQLFRLNWKIGEHSLGLKLDAVYRHIQSPREDFDNFSNWYFSNGMTALLKLPWKMELSTDLTACTRTNYNDPAMNGTEWIWNARLTRPFLKGRLLLTLDGYDLLAQRSNITRIVNAQGRTESYTNTLPHYVLLHAVYRLNKQPRKK